MSAHANRSLAASVLATLLGRRRSAAVPRLRGGLALERDKPGLDRPIVALPLPAELVLPLLDHRRRELTPLVRVGQRVDRGERLAPGVLASAAGSVVSIAPHPVIHPSGLLVPCVRILVEAPGESVEATAIAPASEIVPAPTLPALERPSVERLREAGVTGLGGAGFSTAGKLLEARERGVHTLLLNGAECEPGIACDEALMEVTAGEIVAGAHDLATLIGCCRVVVAVETDKRAAAAALRTAIALAEERRAGSRVRIELVEVAPVYPSGAERLLVGLACGTRVPGPARPTAHGVLCLNVATARAAYRARLGEPFLTRVVSVGGARAKVPCNVVAAFGTPVGYVLAASGQGERAPGTRLRAGGPLSGFDLPDEAVPLVATTNRLALEPPRPPSTPRPCIRCAACSDVCPVALLPQELLRHARADDDGALVRGGLDACIECGCCDVVCPAAIPLTSTFRHARGRLSERRAESRAAAAAEVRHRRRTERLARRAREPLGSLRQASPRGAESAVPGADESAGRTPAGHGVNAGTADPTSDTILPGTASAAEPASPTDPVAAALARARRRGRRG